MLKSSNDNGKLYHQDSILNEPSSASSSLSASQKIIFTDDHVELYIQAFFKVSPRVHNGTAPAYEWLQFLELYNEREGHYILTDQQMEAIKPYCEMNQDVEMTPEDFIRLIHLIRHGKLQQQQQQVEEEITPQMSVSSITATKKLFDSRPRSSKLISKKSLSSYYEDRASANHPDSDNDPIMNDRARRRSDYDNNDDNNNYHHNTENDNTNNHNDHDSSNLVKALKKEKSNALRQLREYETRISNMSKEHSERILQLQTRLEYMNIDAEQQKALLLQQKNKERERLDKIAELQAVIDDSDSKNSIALKKHQKKNEELEKLKEKLSSLQETENIAESKLHDVENELFQAKEVIRVLEKEKSDLHMQIDQEKRLNLESRQELRDQQNENTKLMEIIDRQKFDLDEARSGLRYYTASPALDKKSLNVNNTEETSLAHEQIAAEYMKKIAFIENERDEYQKKLIEKEKIVADAEEQLSNAQNILNESIQIQGQQKLTISTLSSQFDQQHKLMDSIKSSILLNNTPPLSTQSKVMVIMNAIAWFFLFYHLCLIAFISLYHGSSKIFFYSPKHYVFRQLDEWISKYISH